MNIYDSLLLLPLIGTVAFLYWDLFTYNWNWVEEPVADQ